MGVQAAVARTRFQPEVNTSRSQARCTTKKQQRQKTTVLSLRAFLSFFSSIGQQFKGAASSQLQKFS
jgi:hypothetical protein